LDGVASSDGRIVFMTTNYVERLDPALIRPGRVDFKQYIGYATEYQAVAMFMRFYPKESEQMAHEFAQKLLHFDKQISSAQIQGYLMLYKDNPSQALNSLDLYFNK
jgi:chaperone BCS1